MFVKSILSSNLNCMYMESEKTNVSYEIVSYLTLRKAIGWLGMLLPFLLLGGNYVLNSVGIFDNEWFVRLSSNYNYQNQGSYKSSVSHYYYTTVGEIFTGVLFAVALFMFCYSGHPKRDVDKGLSDSAMTNLAGLFLLGVIAFPTTSDIIIKDNLRSFISSGFIGWVHYGFAAAFFIVLAFMSMVNFRRAKKPELFGTGPDDPFYLWCGIVMIACLILVPILSCVPWFQEIHSTFILEAIALMAFGLSWLKKGQADFSYVPKKIGSMFRKQNSHV